MPELLISVTDRYPYEIAADVLAVIGFPEASAERQKEVANQLCGWYIHELISHAEEHGYDPTRWIDERYLPVDETQTNKLVRQLNRRLSHRARSAHVAIPMLQTVAPGTPPKNPPGLDRRTVEKISSFVLQDEGGDLDNFKKRKWQPSQAVIHLAAAWKVKNEDCVRNGMEPPGIFDLMCSGQNIIDLVNEAQTYEAYVTNAKPLKLANEYLIRIRLIP